MAKAEQKIRKKSRINSTTHLPAVRTGAFWAKRYKWSTRRGHRRDAPLGRMPTRLGGTSIASGYTPSALAGALPQHPLPLKGSKSAVQRKAPPRKICAAETKKRPVAKRLRIAPVYTKKRSVAPSKNFMSELITLAVSYGYSLQAVVWCAVAKGVKNYG